MELRAFEGALLSIELGQNLGSKLSSEEKQTTWHIDGYMKLLGGK